MHNSLHHSDLQPSSGLWPEKSKNIILKLRQYKEMWNLKQRTLDSAVSFAENLCLAAVMTAFSFFFFFRIGFIILKVKISFFLVPDFKILSVKPTFLCSWEETEIWWHNLLTSKIKHGIEKKSQTLLITSS